MVKLLLEHGSNPNLANEKEQTPLDVCPNEDIRQLLTNAITQTKSTHHSDSEDPTAETELPIPAHSHSQPSPLHVDVAEFKLKEKEESVEQGEEKGRDEEDCAFLPDPQFIPKATAAQSISATTAEDTTQQLQLPEGTPSRARRRGKRERGFALKGKGHSDVSSSESESELLAIVRKVPRLVDRLPSSVEEGSSADEQLVSEASVMVREEGGKKVEGEGEGESKDSDIEVEDNTNQEEGKLDSENVREGYEGEIEKAEKVEEGGQVTYEGEELPERDTQVANKQEDKEKLDPSVETTAEENLTSMNVYILQFYHCCYSHYLGSIFMHGHPHYIVCWQSISYTYNVRVLVHVLNE